MGATDPTGITTVCPGKRSRPRARYRSQSLGRPPSRQLPGRSPRRLSRTPIPPRPGQVLAQAILDGSPATCLAGGWRPVPPTARRWPRTTWVEAREARVTFPLVPALRKFHSALRARLLTQPEAAPSAELRTLLRNRKFVALAGRFEMTVSRVAPGSLTNRRRHSLELLSSTSGTY